MSSSNDSYPEPEGWGKDGFWADSGIDADYETGITGAVRPATGPQADPGYSYWSDEKGWENSPGANAGPQAGDATSLDATRAAFPGGNPGGNPGDRTRMDYRGAPGAADPAGYYGAPGGPGDPRHGPGGPGGPGGPAGRGPGRPGGPGGPGGRNGKRKGSWWRHWTWKKALALTGGVFGVFLLAMIGVYEYLASSATIPAALASASYQNTTVFYSDGTTPIGTIGLVNRQDLTLQQIPENLQNAVLAAEERSYWTDGAISPTGILRAAYDDLMSSGGSLSGGSTITQEFVRNYYDGVGLGQTASRKIKEIFIAQKLAKAESKQWVLEHYLNLIYLGDSSYGVSAAAQTYFGKSVSQLSVAQDAVIAAIIQAPSTYPLPAYRKDLIRRWHYSVLDGMVKMNVLTQAQENTITAAPFPKLLTDSGAGTSGETSYSSSSNDPWVPYIMNVVYNELTGVQHVPAQQIETGGLKIVTTISKSMEQEMYKAVDENMAQIKYAPGATVTSLPSYMRIGAELQNPSSGAIIAMYPGPGQNMNKTKCAALNCDENTAVYAREQVGSSFKPYVLSTAVQQGMNVQTSILNAGQYLCVPPDGVGTILSKQMTYYSTTMCDPGWFPVENDGGEAIGSAKTLWGVPPQVALAQSSNSAFTDLAHRVSTKSIVDMAQQYGVNISGYSAGGSGLPGFEGGVGMALGTAPLTVNEQTTMLSTIDNNGMYHQAHVIKYWEVWGGGAEQKPTVDTHQVLTSQLDSQVQYAMDMTTVNGTGTAAAAGLGSRPIIAKTGTTTNSHSGFFIGAIPQYSLVVGIFTASQNTNSSESVAVLGGGGFGGYWPAKIWNTFALDKFANLPVENFQNPVFTGAKWNQVGKLPAKKKTKKKTNQCTQNGHGRHGQPAACQTATANPTPTPTNSNRGQPSPTSSPTVSTTASATASPTVSPTVTATGTQTPTGVATTPGGQGAARTVSGVQVGVALGGVLAVLPGSLLWTNVATRRRRRRRAGAGG